MHNNKGILANTLSLIASLIAIGFGYFVLFLLFAFALGSGEGGSIFATILFYSFYAHAAIIIVKFVFSILGYKTKRVTPAGFLKLGWITIVNIVLCLLDVVLSIIYLCVVPQVWFMVIAPIALYALATAFYIIDYVQNKNLALKQSENEQQVENL